MIGSAEYGKRWLSLTLPFTIYSLFYSVYTAAADHFRSSFSSTPILTEPSTFFARYLCWTSIPHRFYSFTSTEDEKRRTMVAQQTFNEQQIADFQEAFSLFDNKGDGKIFAGQLGEVLRALGQNPTEAEVRKYQQQYKPDQRISFDVFLPILHEFSRSKEPYSYDGFIEGLRHFDTEGNGLIKTSELRHLLTTLGDKLTEDEFKDLISGHEDSNGNINYEDFIKNLMSA